MQSTIYVELAPGVSVGDLHPSFGDLLRGVSSILQLGHSLLHRICTQHLGIFYENEEFVVLLKGKEIPHSRHVRGSKYCIMNVFPDRFPGRAKIISIDNLVKGASGRAL